MAGFRLWSQPPPNNLHLEQQAQKRPWILRTPSGRIAGFEHSVEPSDFAKHMVLERGYTLKRTPKRETE